MKVKTDKKYDMIKYYTNLFSSEIDEKYKPPVDKALNLVLDDDCCSVHQTT